MRTCPVSGAEMTRETHHGITIDRSPHGIWLDKGELAHIVRIERDHATVWERVHAVLAPWFHLGHPRPDNHGLGDGQRDLRCPVCENLLTPDSYEDVNIDRCRQHGVWLDAGELDLIVQRIKDDAMFMRGAALRLSDLDL